MDVGIFERLHREGVINDSELAAVTAREECRQVSVHWDLRTLLYFSVLLLATGLGILLYKNIDTIGHGILVAFAGILAAACFFYCFKTAAQYSNLLVASPNVWFDYLLMLGSLSMLAFVGYLQFQYQVFGARWGLATFIPMIALFCCAYYFDHKGVLILAITNLGAWMGVAVAPLQMIKISFHTGVDIVMNGIILGLLLHVFCRLSLTLKVKSHFEAVYRNFGMHILFVSLIAAMFVFPDWYALWFLVLAGVAVYYVVRSTAAGSFYFLVTALLYVFVAVGYVVIRQLIRVDGDSMPYLIIFYLAGSGIALVRVLMYYNKKLKGK